MSDESIIVEGTGSIFLAGSYLVKAAIGEDIDNETLGGAQTHDEISGVTDYSAPTKRRRWHTSASSPRTGATWDPRRIPRDAAVSPGSPSICGVVPDARTEPYDTRDLLDALVDQDSFTEYKSGYGKTWCGVCADRRLERGHVPTNARW